MKGSEKDTGRVPGVTMRTFIVSKTGEKVAYRDIAMWCKIIGETLELFR